MRRASVSPGSERGAGEKSVRNGPRQAFVMLQWSGIRRQPCGGQGRSEKNPIRELTEPNACRRQGVAASFPTPARTQLGARAPEPLQHPVFDQLQVAAPQPGDERRLTRQHEASCRKRLEDRDALRERPARNLQPLAGELRLLVRSILMGFSSRASDRSLYAPTGVRKQTERARTGRRLSSTTARSPGSRWPSR